MACFDALVRAELPYQLNDVADHQERVAVTGIRLRGLDARAQRGESLGGERSKYEIEGRGANGGHPEA